MGYEIDYSHISDRQVKMTEALKDCYNYLSPKAVSTLYQAAMECKRYDRFSFLAQFAGVSGPPAVAFWEDVKQTCQDMTQ